MRGPRIEKGYASLLFSVAVFCLLTIQYGKLGMLDDAFISFRYAENFSDGHGLVFNVDEKPIEGYSNFLWTILLAGCFTLGFDTSSSAQTLGIVCGTVILATMFVILKAQKCNSFGRSLALLTLATAPAFGVYAISGMETILFTLVLLVFAYGFYMEESGRWTIPVSAVCAPMVVMTRPEGIILISVFVLYRLFRLMSNETSANKKWTVMWLAIVVGTVMSFYVWRFLYYGYLFPMPVYAKVTSPGLYREYSQVLGGIKYCIEFTKTYGGGIVFPVTVFLAVQYLVKRTRTAAPRKGLIDTWPAVLSVLLLWYVVYAINVGGDWMPQFRFYVPLLPAFYLMIMCDEFKLFGTQNSYYVVLLLLLMFNIFHIPLTYYHQDMPLRALCTNLPNVSLTRHPRTSGWAPR